MSDTYDMVDGAGRPQGTYTREGGYIPAPEAMNVPIERPQPAEPVVAWLDPEPVDQQARDRALILRCQLVQNAALAVLLPVLGVLTVVLLAGLCRLIWTV